jgi:hypothetical protein
MTESPPTFGLADAIANRPFCVACFRAYRFGRYREALLFWGEIMLGCTCSVSHCPELTARAFFPAFHPRHPQGVHHFLRGYVACS